MSGMPTRVDRATLLQLIGDEDVQIVVEGGGDICVVLDCDDMAVGRIHGSGLDADPGRQVADVMDPGPSTVRADTPLQPLIERLRSHNAPNVIVTTPKEDFSGFSCVTKPPDCSPGKHLSESGATANAVPGAGPTPVSPTMIETSTTIPDTR